MTEETQPGFLANYKIVRPDPAKLGQARQGPPGRASPELNTRDGPGQARPSRIRLGLVDTSSI